jgi:methyl-accepting chemotaxis protein
VKLKRSLRFRLVFSYLAIITLTIIGFSFLVNRVVAGRFREMVGSAAEWRIERTMPLLQEYYADNGSWQGVEEVLNRTFYHREREFGDLGEISETGERPNEGSRPEFVPFFRKPGKNDMQPPEDRTLLLNQQGMILFDSYPESVPVEDLPLDLDQGSPILVDGETVGTIVVASSFGVYNRFQNTFLNEVNYWMAGAGLLAVLLVVSIGTLQARRIVSPVQSLEKAARRVADGDLNQRIPVTS